MEMWSLINKNTNKLIRCGHAETGDDQGERYFFSEVIYYPYWFVESEELAKKSLNSINSSCYDEHFQTPSTLLININDWEVISFIKK